MTSPSDADGDTQGELDWPDPLDAVVFRLRASWVTAQQFSEDRWLEQQFGSAWNPIRHRIGAWHRESLFIGCRRLYDPSGRGDNWSVWHTLSTLRDKASLVTQDVVSNHAGYASRTYSPARREGHAHRAREYLRSSVEQAGGVYEGRLTRRAVQLDLDELERLARTLKPFVDGTIAHHTSGIRTIDLGTVDVFLDFILECTRRWSLTLGENDFFLSRTPRDSVFPPDLVERARHALTQEPRFFDGDFAASP